ncbi:lipopolysaccharide biosynthesis protein [Glaciecola petra]|uniref:Lipopolysaccharide biosynthesis protein n=1 Tax=Glaciecola petra TaxID=3075602 RepID=A0ABU2ZMM1_9ALTE|nr:lipopolysaccharide biosynthesis protein [Aestuariibacter sp. P117]MDT0593661.1 lipopolysaccharide biosynthesis protein [Aestuariibacter sp. P117]
MFIEKFGNVALRVIAIISLARLLGPEEFGLFALAAVVVSICSILVDSGLGGALIKKSNISKEDYETVFVFNVLVSVLLTFLLILISDSFGKFYDSNELSTLLKALSVVLIVKALSIVQMTKLTKELKFKPQAKIVLLSYLISLIVACVLAFYGYGYWALVWQQIIEASLTAIMFIIYANYFPKFKFNTKSFKDLYSFGLKLMLASFIKTIYQQTATLIIGKRFDPGTVGLFNQANKIIELYVNAISAIIDKASFPILVKQLEKNGDLTEDLKRLLITSCFLSFFAISVIGGMSDSIVIVLLGDKWLEAAWMLEILSLCGVFIVVESVTRSGLKSLGKAGKILQLEIIKRSFSIFILILAANFGLAYILWALVINSAIGAFLNVIAISKYTGYKISTQLANIAVPLSSGFCVYLILKYLKGIVEVNIFAELFTLVALTALLYIGMGYLSKSKEIIELLSSIKFISKFK